MDRLGEFVSNHLILVSGFFIVFALLVKDLLKNLGKNFTEIPPNDATRLINHDDALVIDVREEAEYKKGHILNAKHIPLGTFENELSKLESFRAKPVIVACRSGNQSLRACNLLANNGFEKVHNLKGGMMNWQSLNLPVNKSK